MKQDKNVILNLSPKEKIKFDNLWPKFKPYADKHFLKEIETNFHQRSWEMYLGNVLLEKGLSIKSQNNGPDFIVNYKIYIECIAPIKGNMSKPDSVPKMIYNKPFSEKIYVQAIPVDQIILRITNAIEEKIKKFNNWKKKQWFDNKKSFVIAINIGDLEYPDNPDMPSVIQALFGFQYMQINRRTRETSFSFREKIQKSNKQPVPVTYFVDDNFSMLSGVLFSETRVLDHPDNIGEDCFFVNNPFADNSVDKFFIQLFKNWIASKNSDGIKLKKNY